MTSNEKPPDPDVMSSNENRTEDDSKTSSARPRLRGQRTEEQLVESVNAARDNEEKHLLWDDNLPEPGKTNGGCIARKEARWFKNQNSSKPEH